MVTDETKRTRRWSLSTGNFYVDYFRSLLSSLLARPESSVLRRVGLVEPFLHLRRDGLARLHHRRLVRVPRRVRPRVVRRALDHQRREGSRNRLLASVRDRTGEVGRETVRAPRVHRPAGVHDPRPARGDAPGFSVRAFGGGKHHRVRGPARTAKRTARRKSRATRVFSSRFLILRRLRTRFRSRSTYAYVSTDC